MLYEVITDDVHIVMSHTHGVDNQQIHKLAWDAFMAGTQVAREDKFQPEHLNFPLISFRTK